MNKFTIRGQPQKDYACKFIQALNPDKVFDVEVRPHTKKRTLSQNALMWKWLNEVVAQIADDTGNGADDVHEFFKRKFLTPKIIEIGGEVSERWSTKDLDTKSMSEYMEKIYAYCTAIGYVLTLPGGE